LHVEKLLKTLQEKEREIFGPLSKLWALMEEEESVEVEDGDEEASSTFHSISSHNPTCFSSFPPYRVPETIKYPVLKILLR